MSKRTLERDVEALSETILSELSADDRLALFVEAAAEENDAWLERLRETCPQPHWWEIDLPFVLGGHYAKSFADQAVYDLHTALLHYRRVEAVHGFALRLDLDPETSLPDASREAMMDCPERLRSVFVELYTTYHANRRFAEKVLEVDFRTWLALHPNGQRVLEDVETVLDEAQWDPTRPEWLTDELAEHVIEWEPMEPGELDHLADARFEVLATTWDDLRVSTEP